MKFQQKFTSGRLSSLKTIAQVVDYHVEDWGDGLGSLESIENKIKGLREVLGHMAELLTDEQKIALAEKMHYAPAKENT